MTNELEEKLACSLTGAKTTEIIQFLPYLFQDFWELGSDPVIMEELIVKHIRLSENTRMLDLGCGKGAVSVRIARKLGIKVKGIDLIPEFIEFAMQKATEFSVDTLCNFSVGDINKAVETETGYDCVVFGAVGNVLGSPTETLTKLKATIRDGGFILMDEAYLPEGGKQESIKYDYEYLTERQWLGIFDRVGLELVESDYREGTANLSSDSGMAAITERASELVDKHPDKKDMFDEFVSNQQNEYDDIENSLVCVTWLLKKK
jgi:ubiquinone/menaquinone biosynthesis C-methylase UbiE